MVTIPDALKLTQPVVVFVITTLYVPGTEVVNVATFPGGFAPVGIVHA